MIKRRKPKLCHICQKRPVWNYKNSPKNVCKRCYHKHIWVDSPSAKKSLEETEVLLIEPEDELIFDGYTGEYYPANQYRWWL